MTDRLVFYPWQTLSDRERLVWAAGYAAHPDDPDYAAVHADALVWDLRRLSLDHADATALEYDAARAGVNVSRDDFVPWYRVAWRMRHDPHAQDAPSATDIDAAFERFAALREDMP